MYSKDGTTKDRKVLWGVTSFGTAAKGDTIGIYTKVYEEMDWIKPKILGEEKLECNKNKVFCTAQL